VANLRVHATIRAPFAQTSSIRNPQSSIRNPKPGITGLLSAAHPYQHCGGVRRSIGQLGEAKD
jgi:hypothetical protein